MASHSMAYDVLGRRISKTTSNDAEYNGTVHYYYDGQRNIEERGSAQTATLKQVVYGPAYVDDEVQIAMNQDPANATTGTNMENDCERFYYVEQDGNWNVIGLTAPSGDLVDRYEYSAYGKRTVFGHGFRYASNQQSAQGPMLADFDGDGVVGDDDDDVMDAELAAPSAGSVADLNGDGLVNAADATIFDSWLYSDQGSADEQMMHVAGSSARMMLADGTTSFVALNELGHQGLMHDEETGLVYNFARYLSPTLERYTSPDPMGYPDGGNRYESYKSNPSIHLDPTGLRTVHIIIYVDAQNKPATFRTNAVSAQLTSLMAPVVATLTKDQLNFQVLDRWGEPDPKSLGWQYDRPGGWMNYGNWDYVPIVGWIRKIHRACSKEKQQWTGWVYFENGGLGGGQTAQGGAKTRLSPDWFQAKKDMLGDNSWNWDIVWANAIAHDNLYHGALNNTFHDGNTGDFSSTDQFFNALATLTPEWITSFKNHAEVK